MRDLSCDIEIAQPVMSKLSMGIKQRLFQYIACRIAHATAVGDMRES